jgi:hypothetical protein
MPYRNKKLSREIRGKLRHFYRLLLSCGDFKQAHYIASYILAEKLHDSEDHRLLEALNCAMIVAYCRPFSGNDRSIDTRIPDLPKSFLRDLSFAEKEIHEVVLRDRNTVLAHSDSIAHDLQPKVWIIKDHKILMPEKNYTRAPLTKEATETFRSLVFRLSDKLRIERMKLEPELINYFEQIPIEKILEDSNEIDNTG